MSKLLLDENPLLIMPQLAVKIGLNEAIILQQIHYWLQINEKARINFNDGFYWTYNSIPKWQEQFPFWSIPTIQRILSKLEKSKLIISNNYNKLKHDRTKWYRIDYERLANVEKSTSYQNDMMDNINLIRPSYQNDTMDNIKMIRPIPETITETNSKTTEERKAVALSPVDNLHNIIKEDIGDVAYKTWIATLMITPEGDTVTIKAPNAVIKGMVASKYMSVLETRLKSFYGANKVILI